MSWLLIIYLVIKTAKNKYHSIVIRLVSDFFSLAKKFSINRYVLFFLLFEMILCRCSFLKSKLLYPFLSIKFDHARIQKALKIVQESAKTIFETIVKKSSRKTSKKPTLKMSKICSVRIKKLNQKSK